MDNDAYKLFYWADAYYNRHGEDWNIHSHIDIEWNVSH